ncbi:hypothetical protein [Nocardia sp. NPDC049149]|uniref:phage tail protein n=1 Tax=Nocardia sp. NPDC049149 TaxID=3364315 RepID=UPI0037131335
MAEAVELAVTYVSIVGETSKLAESIRDAMREGQRYATAHPIKIKADVDVSHIGAVEIPVRADTTRFTREIRDAVKDAQRYATAHPITIDANVRTEGIPRDIQRSMREIGRRFSFEVQVTAVPDFARFPTEMRRGLAQMQRLFGSDWNVSVGVNLDSGSALAQMAILRRELEAMARPINQSVNVDVDRSAVDRLRSIGSVSGVGALVAGGAAAAAAAIAAIGGAAGAALGAVGALGVGIAGLGPAAAAAGATVAVGVQGIGDAFKALGAASESSGADAAAQSKAVAAAEDQLISAYEQRQSAIEGVQDAQRTLTDAEKDARDAVSDVARAYKDAADELEDYQLKLRDANLSEREAELALREAREEFAKAPGKDREKAFLRMQRAELRLAEAQERNRDVTEEAADANAKGIEGSDKVVAAKDRAAQADQRVADAQRGVEKANDQVDKANRQVAKAQQALTDATTGTSAAQDKAAQALAKLSPEARAWVLAVREMKPAWTDLKDAVQDSLFKDSAAGIRDLATAALPTLKAGMVDVAGSINGLTHQFAAFWAAPQNLEGVRAAFAGAKGFIDGLGPGLQQATTGILSLGQAFEPVSNKVGAQFAGMLGQIGEAFTDTFQNGQLTQLISTFGDILAGLGAGLNPLIQGLIQMGNIVGPALGPFFEQFGKSIQALAPSMGQLGATFVNVLTDILPDLEKFIAALATGLEPVLPVIGELLKSLMTALTPMIGPLSQIAQVVGTALAQAITALAPSIGPLSEAFASLVTAFAPILPVIAEVAAGIISALAPALKTIFDALAPVIKQWTELMLPVFRQLQPILADVAQKIGTAIADALVQITPYIPDIAKSFGDLVLALAPLLPQLVQIAVELLPPFLDLVIAILPQLLKLVDVLTWLTQNVIGPIVIPMLRDLTAGFKDGFEAAAAAVNIARDLIGSALGKMASDFEDLGRIVSAAWDGIVHGIAVGVRKIGELLQRVEIPDWVPGIGGKGTSALGSTLIAWAATQGAARGGMILGPGSRTSDSIPVMLSNGEYVVNAASTAKMLPLLQAINAGWVPSADFLKRLLSDRLGFAGGGLVTDNEKARMGGGSVNLSLWQAIKNKFPNAQLTSAKTDHDVDGGFHPKGKAIDVSPDRQILDYLWTNRNQLAQIIFDDPNKVWYNVNGERAEGAKARAIYTEGVMKQHANHIHVAAASEFKDSGIAQQRGALDNRTDKEKVVDEIVAVGKSMGASDEAITAALATGLVEKELRNTPGGPDGSTGVFQQRDFDEWTKGGTRDRLKISDSARTFFEKFNETDASLSPGQRAQAVQRSAFPAKYDQRMAEAGQLYKESQARGSSDASSGASSASSSSAGSGDAQHVFVVNWPSSAQSQGTTSAVTQGATPGQWWDGGTEPATSPQLAAPTTPDIGSGLASAGSDFLDANLNDFLGTLGIRSSGGAIQELVKVIQTQMAAVIAEELRKSRTNATSFIGRR